MPSEFARYMTDRFRAFKIDKLKYLQYKLFHRKEYFKIYNFGKLRYYRPNIQEVLRIKNTSFVCVYQPRPLEPRFHVFSHFAGITFHLQTHRHSFLVHLLSF